MNAQVVLIRLLLGEKEQMNWLAGAGQAQRLFQFLAEAGKLRDERRTLLQREVGVEVELAGHLLIGPAAFLGVAKRSPQQYQRQSQGGGPSRCRAKQLHGV